MTTDIDAVGITAIFCDVFDSPGKSRRDVFDLSRVRMLRGQAIARNDRHKPGPRITISEWRIVGAIPTFPGPAMNKEKYRRVGFAFRHVNIQFVFWRVLLGAFAVD